MEVFTQNQLFEDPNFNVFLNRFYTILEYHFGSEFLEKHLVIGGSVAESRQKQDGRTTFKDLDFITNSEKLYQYLPQLERVLPGIESIVVQSSTRTIFNTDYGKAVEVWYKPNKEFQTTTIDGIVYEILESINEEREKYFPTKLTH